MKLFFRKVSKKTWTFLCVFIAFEILSLWVYHRCTFLDWPIHVFSYQATGPWMMNGLEEYGRKNPLPDKLDSRFYFSSIPSSPCCHAMYQEDKLLDAGHRRIAISSISHIPVSGRTRLPEIRQQQG